MHSPCWQCCTEKAVPLWFSVWSGGGGLPVALCPRILRSMLPAFLLLFRSMSAGRAVLRCVQPGSLGVAA